MTLGDSLEPYLHRYWECPMRLARLVVAGLLLGAAIAFLAALFRPRHAHRQAAPLPSRSLAWTVAAMITSIATHPARPRSAGSDR